MTRVFVIKTTFSSNHQRHRLKANQYHLRDLRPFALIATHSYLDPQRSLWTLALMTVADTSLVQNLYLSHHRWLHELLRRRLSNAMDAADLAHDTFIRVLKRPQTFNGEVHERSYLATIARRVMVDSFRRRALEQAYLEALALQPETYALSPEDKLLMVEALHAVDAMLDGLGRKVKQAFLLSQLQGMPYKEIAEQLGVSVSSVTQYVAKASEHCLLFALESER